MLVTLICPNCHHRIEGMLYPLFGDMETDCPVCALHIEIEEGRLQSLVFSALTADEPVDRPPDRADDHPVR